MEYVGQPQAATPAQPQQAGIPQQPGQPGQPGGFGLTPGETPKKPHLYVGNLSGRVTDYILTEIFAVAGPVVQAKIIQDRNFQHGGMNYGFVEYQDMRSAEQALQTLNGRKIFDAEVRVNWAHQGNQNKEDTQHHYHVFVGDLSPEVNDDVLGKAFGAFGSMSEARVMWDMNSGKSRGYGFLSFREKADAEQAIATMNGEWLGSRAIRVNWANQKTQTGTATNRGPGGGGMGGMGGMGSNNGGFGNGGFGGHGGIGGGSPAPSNFGSTALQFDSVSSQTPEYNTTVYVGNLIPYTTQADLIPLFQGYGYIVEIRMQADRGFAFVKLDSHQNAALAITHLQNQLVHGRPIKCSWGKDKGSDGNAGGVGGATSGGPSGVGAHQSTAYPMQHQQMGYPNQYGYYGGYNYGQTGVPGQPGQPQGHTPQHNQHHAQVGQSVVPGQDGTQQPAAQGQWDPAAAAAYYQTGGWGNYYSQGQDGAQNQNQTH